jgi:uncharacterized protein (TIGR00299 family) protein
MIAYFDCSSGISGDMTLGALVDAGVPVEKLTKELSLLPVKGYELKARKVKRAGFRATKVDVIIESGPQSPDHRHKTQARKWKDVEEIIRRSTLSQSIKSKGQEIFKRLFQAEAKVHGSRYDRVHLHELGAVDCIVDIFGTLIGLDILGVETIYASPVNLGSGTIDSRHGRLPVPAPASAELLLGKPVYSSDISFELTTPTGAVLVSYLADKFCPVPDMRISNIGIGAGQKNFREQPNILRLFIEQKAGVKVKGDDTEDEVLVIETNIDDMNPQVYEYVVKRLFKTGALDVFLVNIIMKKGRPGIKLTVLCKWDDKDALMDIIFRETTSIGVRFYKCQRKVLDRDIKIKKTRFGNVRIKKSRLENTVQKFSPEYEDCRKIAKKFNIPLIEVIKAAES